MLPFQFNLKTIGLAALTSALLAGTGCADTRLAHAPASETSVTISTSPVNAGPA